MRRALVVTLALLAFGAGTVLPSSAQVVDWQTVELLPLPDDDAAFVSDVNDAGVSVGASGDGNGFGTPVRWNVDGDPTALPVPEGCTGAMVRDVSNTGLMVGFSFACGGGIVGGERPIRWNANGTLVDVVPATLPSPWPNAVVSDTGYVAGSAWADGRMQPAVQAFAGGPVTLLADGGSPGVGMTVITGLTSYGYLVGNVRFSGPDFLPAGWIGPYAFPLSFADADAVAVSEAGYALLEVRETAGTADDVRGVLVGPGGQVINLHSTAQDKDEMVDINDRNIVLGFRGEADDIYGALFSTSGVVPLEDLAAPGDGAAWGRYRIPVAINNNAWVVGRTGSSGLVQSWLLHPPTA